MLPLICSSWSRAIWLSAATSTLGKSVMTGFMFFMRVAMPLNFCGMRLHMSIHCNSRSCWVKECSSSLEAPLGSEPSRVPGMMFIFLGCAFCSTFLNDMLTAVFSMGRLGAVALEGVGVLETLVGLEVPAEPVPLVFVDTTRSAAATCGATFWG